MGEMPPAGDNELMRLTMQGSREAFETLVLRWRDRAVKRAFGYLRDWQLAEDAAQECFADIYFRRKAYRFDFSFQAYLYALIRSRCVDALRKKKRGPVPIKTPPEAPSKDTPESLMLQKDRLLRLSLMLDRMDPARRRMLVLFARGASYREIGERLGLSLAQVKAGVYRGRRELKAMGKDLL